MDESRIELELGEVTEKRKSFRETLSWQINEDESENRLETKLGSILNHVREGGSTKLGTIMGVFIPTIQNILGIILFIRLPMITGHAGIGGGIAVVLLGCSASFLTSLSMSAIATNGVPKGGGCWI